MPDLVTLDVVDDGAGFDPAAPTAELGLRMRDPRAATLPVSADGTA